MEAIDASIGSSNADDQPATTAANKKSKKLGKLKIFKSKKQLIIAVIALLLLAAAGLSYYKYSEARKEVNRLSNPQEAAKAEAVRLKDEVSKFFQVPDEVPTIATVVDVSKLKSQSFFANAENGDRVLMFTQARKAILYRPDSKKIIEVAPINLGNTNQTAERNTEDNEADVAPASTER